MDAAFDEEPLRRAAPRGVGCPEHSSSLATDQTDRAAHHSQSATSILIFNRGVIESATLIKNLKNVGENDNLIRNPESLGM
jgi:hypothetical protein